MKKKALSTMTLTLLITSMIVVAFDIRIANASGTIYIRSDGSVDPPTAPITRAGDTYTFTANIYEPIVIEKNNITVDGNGYRLQGTGTGYGFNLTYRSNITIKSTHITRFNYGIFQKFASDNSIESNALTNNDLGGLWQENTTRTTIKNNALANNYVGILLTWSNNTNTITNNSIRNNPFGVMLIVSSNNTIIDNTVANSTIGGIYLDRSNNNSIYHNNIIDNTPQADTPNSISTWDNGYPSGGNYWSDYTGVDADLDGIGDTAYVIDTSNQDRYPLMNTRGTHDVAVTDVTLSKTVIGQGYPANITVAIQNQGTLIQAFNVTVPANASIIQTNTVFLKGGNSTTLVIMWDTSGWAKGAYIISAEAETVPAETYTSDNTFTYGVVKVTVPGDTDGDRDIDIYDIVRIASAYGSERGDSIYEPNADIDSDGDIDIYDVVIAASRYGYAE